MKKYIMIGLYIGGSLYASEQSHNRFFSKIADFLGVPSNKERRPSDMSCSESVADAMEKSMQDTQAMMQSLLAKGVSNELIESHMAEQKAETDFEKRLALIDLENKILEQQSIKRHAIKRHKVFLTTMNEDTFLEDLCTNQSLF